MSLNQPLVYPSIRIEGSGEDSNSIIRVCIGCEHGSQSVSLDTIRSHFPEATGLKFKERCLSSPNGWVAVPLTGGTHFTPPPSGWSDAVSYHVVSENRRRERQSSAIATSRSLLGQPNLADSITSLFGPPTTPKRKVPAATRPYRGKVRESSKKKPKKPVKVVFVRSATLPTALNNSMVLCESLVDIANEDPEVAVRHRLRDAVATLPSYSNISPADFLFLTCLRKTLMQPTVVPGYLYTGERLRALMGQGRLYVQVNSKVEIDLASEVTSDDDLPDTGFRVPRTDDGQWTDENGSGGTDRGRGNDGVRGTDRGQGTDGGQGTNGGLGQMTMGSQRTDGGRGNDASPGTETRALSDDDFAELGTPTVLLNRRRNRLRLTTEPILTTAALTDPTQRSSRLSLQRQSVATATASCSSSTDAKVIQSTSAFEVIDVCDSEDEEIALVIEASLASAGSTKERVGDTSREVGCILKEFRDRYMEEGQTKCVIFRTKPLQSAIHTLERNINLKQNLFVKFSGEIGQDHGGPRREFFRLALSELQQSQFFEGPEGKKVFSHNLNLVEKKQYKIVGRLVAMSLVQDGPGIHFLNNQLFSLMVGEAGEMTPKHEILSETRECLDELENVSTPAERDQYLVKYGDWLADRGINAYRMTVDNKEEMKHMIIKYHVFYRTSTEIAQFIDGMNEVGRLWELITENHASFETLFCHCPNQLTKGDFDSLCDYNFSAEGSNSRIAEEETVYAWEVFLEAIEDGSAPATFPKLMSFLTGAHNIPPCGFPKRITVHFFSQEVGITRLPHVSTCSLDFWLPRGETPESLRVLMLRSINESGGFLKV